MEHKSVICRLGYLSAAPRASTRPDAEAGGPRSHMLGVMRAFAALQWQVHPFIVGDRVPRSWVTKGSERAVTAGFVRTLGSDLIRLYMSNLNARRAWQELAQKVDLVYERRAALQSLGWIFKQHGIPWILETNSPLFYETKAERKNVVLSDLERQLEIQAYRECDLLVCVTQALKEIIVREAEISPEKVIVLPNGVDTSVFDSEGRHPKRIFDNFTIGFVGNLYPWQGLDDLLEVLNDLQTDGFDLSLVVVGDGQMRQEWESKARSLGLSNRVEFVGQVSWDEVPDYIAGFDLGYSGHVKMQIGTMYHSPLKIYEYMAMGKPVLASAFEDAKFALRDGKTGFLFPSGDKQALKSALVRAYESRVALPNMGELARQEILTYHSWTARVRTLIETVEQIFRDREQ
ncbi:glycosyltransferase WbuB [Chroococcidiopsis sp. CCALA 051]|uniref:glycosyltransferase n=1 Tax=Chroococcidiopsis sp. CCALA 051 TaxID=869949 RepID=UPI000D0D4B60|nr:glycosyltransferase [Chroococcidiopsis sp. CCALA 051]MBE9014704.1 glycosyltransferase [Chroococcidiopsidales cyanobacterium LEGE 13417]PSM48697.1 glycosyltransferase WbuB [Chroococcidiopsis sp. CCALA 051]